MHVAHYMGYAPVKVNHASHLYQPPSPPTYDRGMSDRTGESDNSYSFWHHSDITNGRNVDCLGGDSDSES